MRIITLLLITDIVVSQSMAELLDREAKLNALADFDKLDTGLQVYVNTNATNNNNNNNTNVVVSIPQPILHSPPLSPEKKSVRDIENDDEPNGSGNPLIVYMYYHIILLICCK